MQYYFSCGLISNHACFSHTVNTCGHKVKLKSQHYILQYKQTTEYFAISHSFFYVLFFCCARENNMPQVLLHLIDINGFYSKLVYFALKCKGYIFNVLSRQRLAELVTETQFCITIYHAINTYKSGIFLFSASSYSQV